MARKGEFETSEYFLAVLGFYEGLECTKVVTSNNVSGRGRNVTFTFICPEHDAEAIQADFLNKEWCVNLASWLDATKRADSFIVASRANFGVWTSPEYGRRRVR